MITIHVTDHAGKMHTLQGPEGYALMEVIRDAGLAIKAECGGCKSCATCVVDIAPEWMAAVGAGDADETDMIDDSGMDRRAGTRLSCQITLTPALNGLTCTLHEGSI